MSWCETLWPPPHHRLAAALLRRVLAPGSGTQSIWYIKQLLNMPPNKTHWQRAPCKSPARLNYGCHHDLFMGMKDKKQSTKQCYRTGKQIHCVTRPSFVWWQWTQYVPAKRKWVSQFKSSSLSFRSKLGLIMMMTLPCCVSPMTDQQSLLHCYRIIAWLTDEKGGSSTTVLHCMGVTVNLTVSYRQLSGK